VARIAGLPDKVIDKAEEVLSSIEDRMPKKRRYIVLDSYLKKKGKEEHNKLYDQLFLFTK